MIWFDITLGKKTDSNKKIPLLKYYWNTKLILRKKKTKTKTNKAISLNEESLLIENIFGNVTTQFPDEKNHNTKFLDAFKITWLTFMGHIFLRHKYPSLWNNLTRGKTESLCLSCQQYWCSKFYLRKDFANFTVLYELNVKTKYLFIFKGWKFFDVDFVEISATRRAEHYKSVYCLNCRLNCHGTFACTILIPLQSRCVLDHRTNFQRRML